MSLISSVATTAATLAAGLDPVTTTTAGRLKGPAPGGAGSTASLALDALSARLSAAVAKGTAAKKATTGKAGAKATVAKTTAKSTTTKATTKASTTKAGYATTTATADFAFLKDKTLSVEEKLFRFMCDIAQRNDDEVLKKMEEMKGGAAAAKAKATSSSGGSSSSGSAKKSSGFSVWSAIKVAIPALGLASKVLGDAKVKSLIKDLSGPVLAGALTALGLPMLAPLALSAGPGVTSALLDGKLGGEGPAAAGEGTGSSSTSTSGGSGSSSTTSTSATSGKNEQVQMMELQRLVDKQKEMFAMVSNILRAQHDTRMSIIGNVR